MIDAVRDIGPTELARRSQAFNRQMRLAAPFGALPQRQYDLLPALLTAADFAILAKALRHRAQVLNQALDDLYGPRKLLQSGALPPPLVLGNPRFQRGLHAAKPLGVPRLSFYAADVIRRADGQFAIVRDHTGVIPGLGHAFTLRRPAAATVPELFRAGGLHSLRPAREMLVDHLQREAKGELVAVLTGAAGVHDAAPDMMDDALLARALGLLLIEPGDLAARGGALHVKTLSGLLPASLLIRGLSGLELDPLEQGGRPDAGIAGAFGAIRSGALKMLNAPGTALLEAPELLAYIEPLFEILSGRPCALPRLTEDAAPLASRAPFLNAGVLVSHPVFFRLFAWHDGEDWQVLPGGLARAFADAAAPAGSPAMGLKDLWVLDDQEPYRLAGPAFLEAPMPARFLAAANLPSRVADNLFWLGRSVERLDAAARLVMLSLPRLESATSLPRDVAERALIARCLAQARLLPAELASGAVSGRLLRTALSKRKPLAGLVKEVSRLLNAASERFSASMLATIRFALQEATSGLPDEESALPALLAFTATFAGIAAENMSRDGGWLFLEMGRRLERAEAFAETLAILFDLPADRLEPGLGLAVELDDCVLSYDLRHAGILAPAPVFTMLLSDPANPRGLFFQCSALAAALERLGADDDAAIARALAQEVPELSLRTADLPLALGAIAERLRGLSNRVHRRFVALLPEAHQLDDEDELEAAQ